MRFRRSAALFAVALAAVGGLSACSSSSSKNNIVVGSANFAESEIIAYMYVDALKGAGIKASAKVNIGAREVYQKALTNNEINVVPEYVSTVSEYWNTQINGKNASTTNPIAGTDANAVQTKLSALIKSKGLVVGKPSPAADENAFAVTKDFADKNGLKTLSDLSKLNGQITLGAGAECPTRPFCQPGLEKTYGLQFKGFKKFGSSGGVDTINALKDGTIQLGLVFSSSGLVAANNLVLLEDDKKLQQADNIIWMGSEKKVDSKAQAVLDKVNAKMTTEALQQLDKNVEIDHQSAAKAAQKWIDDNGLGKK